MTLTERGRLQEYKEYVHRRNQNTFIAQTEHNSGSELLFGNPSFSHRQVNIESPPPLLSTESTQETWKTNPEYPDIGWDYLLHSD